MRLELVHLLVCYSSKLLTKSCSGFIWTLVRSLSLSFHSPLSQQEGQHCTPWACCWPTTSPCAVGTLQFLSHVGQRAPLGPIQLHMCVNPAANQPRIKMACAAQCKEMERREKGDRCLFLALRVAWALRPHIRLLIHACKAISIPVIWGPFLTPWGLKWKPKYLSGAHSPLRFCSASRDFPVLPRDGVILYWAMAHSAEFQFCSNSNLTIFYERWQSPSKHLRSTFPSSSFCHSLRTRSYTQLYGWSQLWWMWGDLTTHALLEAEPSRW